jgi:c(7)-type cytochrome triheme protein
MTLCVAAGIMLTLGCSTAASVFLDVPQQPGQTQTASSPQPNASLTPRPVLQDTARPPIEAVLDRDSTLALLPIDAAGQVDWVEARRLGVVRPRSSLPGEVARNSGGGFDYDFLLEGPNEMFDALFPHSAHSDDIACQSCHPAIYPYRNKTITMREINDGKSCGRCHGTVAFSAATCVRCHSAMPAPSPKPAAFHEDIYIGASQADGDSTHVPSSQPVRFPHWTHRIRYQCSACHPALFEMRAGSSSLTMSDIQSGQGCGACHDGDSAFGLFQCDRCHVQGEPQEPTSQ